MKNRSVVSIDLGSAFTKVAVRRGWDGDGSLLHDLPLGAEQDSFCVPSVVAFAGGRTLIGREAAELPVGADRRVFRNWKARLFRVGNTLDAASGTEMDGPQENAEYLAVQFLTELRKSLEGMQGGPELVRRPARICVPHSHDGDAVESLIRTLFVHSGWRPAEDRTILTEPESNAIGLITRGTNRTRIPRRVPFQSSQGRWPFLSEMVGPPLSNMMRAMKGSYGLLVVDIGAFTTDFGHVELDATFNDDWNRPAVVQRSVSLGVRELDKVVFGLLPDSARAAFREQPLWWEQAKRALYSGKTFALPGDGELQLLGAAGQGNEIACAIAEFAQRVIAACSEFRSSVNGRPLQGLAFTGGGALIPGVREAIKTELKSTVRWFYDLQDNEEIRKRHSRVDGTVNEKAVSKEAQANLLYLRGGSAIGGCSVFFETQ